VRFSGIFRSLMDISGNLTLVEFGRIPRLVESGGFFRRGVNISGNLRLMDFSGFPRFKFGVKTVHYKALLFIIGGGK